MTSTIKSYSFLLLFLFAAAFFLAASAGAALPNSFPVKKNVDAFHNQTVKEELSFSIYFPVNETQYVPVSDKLAALLSVPPLILPSGDLKVRVTNITCTPQDIWMSEGPNIFKASGGIVKCEIEITAGGYVKTGRQEVILSFSTIDTAFMALNAKSPSSRAEAHLNVMVWSSPAEKEKVMARIKEELKRKEEIRAEEARQQAAALAREKAERRAKFLRKAAPWGAGVLVSALVVFVFRRRLWPDVKVVVRRGGHEQQRNAVSSVDADEGVPVGTIVETVWARNWRGRRSAIKVEYLAVVADSSPPDDIVEMAFAKTMNRGTLSNTYRWNARLSKLDVLVTAGASLKRGTYMAEGNHGNVKVKVR